MHAEKRCALTKLGLTGIFAGSVFVSRRAREFLAGTSNHLRASMKLTPRQRNSRPPNTDPPTLSITSPNDSTKQPNDCSVIKTTFNGFPLVRHSTRICLWVYAVDLSSSWGMSPSHSTFLNSQQLSAEVAELFEPSIQAAVTSIKAQVVASQGMIKVGSSTC